MDQTPSQSALRPASQALDRAPSAPAVLRRAGKNALFAADEFFAGPCELGYLIGEGEVAQRLGRGFAELFHRAVQIGQGFTDRNQLAAFTLHGFSFSHARQTRPQKGDDPF